MELDIQELCREKVLAEEAGARAQEDHDRRERDLRERLQDVRRALEIAKRNLEDAQYKVVGLTDDLNKSRKSELKYRKKYYALKQEVAAVKKNSRSGRHPPDEDEPLIVV
ncbi:hypothetical protein PHLGIDRAFT_477661 [Phlebiopsis gigantea 11061_1 CR5-6]|uniref:Uncharacterized protein n=1 Tax=Phlebiopsis gigantea (strain 11061_1 CR5-6) TaxID=745531 RepID=A0A0C3RWN5_PHLG1|nr:hypothetical protein PHLGIDRAFT_477661 [Phlebiopsis gigantea 11061_1 CR5-6]